MPYQKGGNSPVATKHVALENVRLPNCWLDKPRRNTYREDDHFEYFGVAAFRKDSEAETEQYNKMARAIVEISKESWPDIDKDMMYATDEGERRKVRVPVQDGDGQKPSARAPAEWKPWAEILNCKAFRFKCKAKGGPGDPKIYWHSGDADGNPVELDRAKHAGAIGDHLFGGCLVARIGFRVNTWEVESNRFVSIYPAWVQLHREPGTRKSSNAPAAGDLDTTPGAPPPEGGGAPPPRTDPPAPPPSEVESRYQELDDEDDDIPF